MSKHAPHVVQCLRREVTIITDRVQGMWQVETVEPDGKPARDAPLLGSLPGGQAVL